MERFAEEHAEQETIMFYNSSAWVYVVGYAVIALLGNLIALPFRKS